MSVANLCNLVDWACVDGILLRFIVCNSQSSCSYTKVCLMELRWGKKKSEFQGSLVTHYIIYCENVLNFSLIPHKLGKVMGNVILGYKKVRIYEPPDHLSFGRSQLIFFFLITIKPLWWSFTSCPSSAHKNLKFCSSIRHYYTRRAKCLLT